MKHLLALLCAACACVWLTGCGIPSSRHTAVSRMPAVRQLVAQQSAASRSWVRHELQTVRTTTPTPPPTTPTPAPVIAAQPKPSPSVSAHAAVTRRSVATGSPAADGTAKLAAAGPTVWDKLAGCESGGNWADTEGLFEGGLQFLNSTWLAMGGGKYAQHAYQATREQQIAIARKTLAASSWKQQWPTCSRKLGLR